MRREREGVRESDPNKQKQTKRIETMQRSTCRTHTHKTKDPASNLAFKKVQKYFISPSET